MDDVEVEGEMVTTNGDATKGLRELVRRSTIGEPRPAHEQTSAKAVDELDFHHLQSATSELLSRRYHWLLCPRVFGSSLTDKS